jgi:hypothetical protein
VLLEVEELLGLYDRERMCDTPTFEKVAQGSRRSVTCVVPAFEREDRARPAKRGPGKSSYGVHDGKAIGRAP